VNTTEEQIWAPKSAKYCRKQLEAFKSSHSIQDETCVAFYCLSWEPRKHLWLKTTELFMKKHLRKMNIH